MRILILEDDRATAQLLAMLLTTAGHVVEHGLDGAEGMKKLRVTPCDLVISDVFMVPIDGFEFLAAARAEFPRLLVVLASASSDLNTLVAKQPHKPFDVVHKPFRIEEIKRVLARASEALSVQAGIAQAALAGGEALGGDPNVALLEDLARLFPGAPYAATCAQLTRFMRQPGNAMVVTERGLLSPDVWKVWRHSSPQPNAPWEIVTVEADPAAALAALFTDEGESRSAISKSRGGTLVVQNLDLLSIADQARLSSSLKGTPAIRLLITLGRDPDLLLDEGLMDESLYIRFSTASVLIPSLADVADQIEPLFVDRLRATPEFPFASTDLQIEAAALGALRGYRWPENLTELQAVAGWVASRMRSPRVTLSQLPERFHHVRLTTLSEALLMTQRDHLRRVQRLSPSNVEAAQTSGLSIEDFTRALAPEATPLFTLGKGSSAGGKGANVEVTAATFVTDFLILASDERMRLSFEAHLASMSIGNRFATDGLQVIAQFLLTPVHPRVVVLTGSPAPFEMSELVEQLRRIAPAVIIATVGTDTEIDGTLSFPPLESMDNFPKILAHLIEAKPQEAPTRPVLKLRR